MNCAIASGVVEQEANESHGVSFKLKRGVAHQARHLGLPC